jgi:hypothetical protein
MNEQEVVEFVNTLDVTSPENYLQAGAILHEIAKEVDEIKGILAQASEPFKTKLATVSREFRPRIDSLEGAEKALKNKLTEAAVASRVAYEEAAAKYQEGKINHSALLAAEQAKLPEKTGALTITVKREYRLLDLDALPNEYKKQRIVVDVDHEALSAAVADGASIPGVEAFYGGRIRLSSRK